jgi:hypothetical protein
MLVRQTSRTGLSRVNGQAQAKEETPSGFAPVEVAVFLVWGAVFPTAVDRVDRRFRSVRGPEKDPRAEVRVVVMRIGLAVLITLMANEVLAGFLSCVALVSRAEWTAAVACGSCLVFPLLSLAPGGVVWGATLGRRGRRRHVRRRHVRRPVAGSAPEPRVAWRPTLAPTPSAVLHSAGRPSSFSTCIAASSGPSRWSNPASSAIEVGSSSVRSPRSSGAVYWWPDEPVAGALCVVPQPGSSSSCCSDIGARWVCSSAIRVAPPGT